MPDFEYSEKSSAEQDIKDLRDAMSFGSHLEVNDGRWVLMKREDYERIQREGENVIAHLESCISEIEGIEVPEPDDGDS
ncbi:hypothetical protein [Azospirillum aestuarii]|uniref:hypothetical protein n=1 Tax=Azospirillum aestuarii TaxID=2802052 RepID=UPI0040551FE3